MMISWTEIAIAAITAVIVAVVIRIFRARADARNRGPAQVCHEFKANGHISNRQAEAVRKALARLEAR
jgi:hypothetical protein